MRGIMHGARLSIKGIKIAQIGREPSKSQRENRLFFLMDGSETLTFLSRVKINKTLTCIRGEGFYPYFINNYNVQFAMLPPEIVGITS